MSRALIIVHNGFTDSEFTYALDRCREEDIDVQVATLDGGNAVGEKGWTAKATFSVHMAHLIATSRAIWNTTAQGPWDILILPGGVKSIEKVRQDPNVIDMIKLHNIADRVIASMCHGAQLLIEAELVRNRRVSGYYSIKTDIINAGGEYVHGVAIDGNIVSASHYDFNGKWMKAVIELWQRNATKE
jgi:protease I